MSEKTQSKEETAEAKKRSYPEVIVVGYRLKPAPYLEQLLPALAADADEKAKKAHEKAVDAMKTNATDNVYLCTFDEVLIHVPSKKKAKRFKSEGRAADQPISRDIRNFLLHEKMFANTWGDSTHGTSGPPKAFFLGFEPRFFLKLLGLECSLPLLDCRLPVEMWFGNSDHRDIGEAVMPKTESKQIDWPQVLAVRRMGLADEDLKAFEAATQGWTGPGVSTDQDVKLTMILAEQLGFPLRNDDE